MASPSQLLERPLSPHHFDRRHLLIAAATAAGAAGASLLLAHKAEASAAREIYTGLLSRTAAGGFDVVAYVTQGRPVEGTRAHAATWKDVAWRFASAEHRAAFLADPERYAPAYGGHCAWAAAQGYRAKGDPRHWRVVGGRLFLNYNAAVHRDWEKDIPRFIAAADANWPRLRQG
jgi:hypothetical protein